MTSEALKCRKELKQLMKNNNHCADCGMYPATWTSCNLGVFICVGCSGIHRILGVNISFVKSATLDDWNNKLLSRFKEQGGNSTVNKKYEATLPSHQKIDPSFHANGRSFEIVKFIRNKYKKKMWYKNIKNHSNHKHKKDKNHKSDKNHKNHKLNKQSNTETERSVTIKSKLSTSKMFKDYKFGDISKSIYNKVIKNDGSASNKAKDTSQPTKQKGYQFGDISKSVYNKLNNSIYQFGDITKSAFHSITAQFEPFTVNIKDPIKEGFLHKRSPLLLTYRKYWAVLQEKTKSIYLFKNKKQYDQCIEIIDLSLYDHVKGHYSWPPCFDIFSSTNSQRFRAPSNVETDEWINCVIKIIGVQKLDEMKETLMSDIYNDSQSGIDLNLNCIAYYIIDLEYNHSESANPQSLLRNQNFIIAAIIWAYMHEDDQRVNMNMRMLGDEQKTALKYWQQPAAVIHAICGGLGDAKLGPVYGFLGGAFVGMAVAGTHGPGTGHDIYKVTDLTATECAIIPLGIIAGTAVGVVYLAPTYFAEAFKHSYEAVQ
eukprot:83684_1